MIEGKGKQQNLHTEKKNTTKEQQRKKTKTKQKTDKVGQPFRWISKKQKSRNNDLFLEIKRMGRIDTKPLQIEMKKKKKLENI